MVVAATWTDPAGVGLLLADIGLGRTPYSDRGVIAGAIVAWIVAVVAVAFFWLRHSSPSADSTAARLEALMKAGAQLALGALLIVGVSGLAATAISRPDLPPGWTIIRPPYEISTLASQADRIWAGGKSGLAAIDIHTGELISTPAAVRGLRRVQALLVDRDQQLWIAHSAGLSRYGLDGLTSYSPADGMLPGRATALLQDRNGSLWIGTRNGVVRRDVRGAWTTFSVAEGLAAPSVDVIFQDRDGLIWFGATSRTRGGLSSYDGRSWKQYSTADGLTHDSIKDILQDERGYLWLATGFANEGGVTRRAAGGWVAWHDAAILDGRNIRSVFQDRSGRMWIGSEYDGVWVHDGLNGRLLTPAEGLAGWEVKDMLHDDNAVLWLATENGISRIEGLGQDFVARGERP